MEEERGETPKGEAPSSGYSRRDLGRLAGLSALALAAPLIVTNQSPSTHVPKPGGWHSSDILVIGSGFAGVFAALEAVRHGMTVTLVDKGTVGWSGLSPWASDSRPFDPSIYDRKEWIDNLAINTEWLFDRKWMDIFLDESMEIFDILERWGCHAVRPFERSTVFRRLLEDAGVTLVERVMVTSLLQDGAGRVNGALGFTYDDSQEPCAPVRFAARAVISCAGAGAYKSPGFPNWGQTFDGDALAYEAGAWITGKEFHDTHPTFSKNPAASYDGWRWAQTVKGAYVMVGPPEPLMGGLTLGNAINVSHGRLMRVPGGGPGGEPPPEPGVPRKPSPHEIANRNYVGKGFLARSDLTLDFGGPPEDGSVPEQGFRVGGATAGMGVHKGEGVYCSDYSCGAAGVPGLYAAGDALGSMLCGPLYPGRGFASFGSAIQGRRAARSAVEYVRKAPAARIDRAALDRKIEALFAPRTRKEGFSPAWVTQVLRNTMTPLHILYIKDPRRLDGALASIEYLRSRVVPHMVAGDGHQLRVAIEAQNMLLNAEMKLRAGLFRTESRGTHFREDYPFRDDANWFCLVVMRKGEDGMVLEKRPLPDAWRPPAAMAYRQRYPRVWPGEDAQLQSRGIA
ncbi:FAD-binding protein [Sphingomonas canadensis]|uniref:FAD-binding protein n=1 Tax=Sphingomonas canadensis TaxID=1219257 RepID=A0ABW3H8N4_9SPHN|nr:FAD-binding protein [Sphingomonas canadensis]MCW3836208.1 FAD-binding protein [Sphingomonas canadensis]